LRGGTQLETLDFAAPSTGYFGFENVAGGFDTLEITSTNLLFARYDNLQFAAAPAAPEVDPRTCGAALAFAWFGLLLVGSRR
jgi:hypothetical protein